MKTKSLGAIAIPAINLFASILFLTALAVSSSTAVARDVLALAPSNTRWHLSTKTSTATFLGKDAKETAALVLKKSSVLESELSIQSDATSISLVSGDARVTIAVIPQPDGTTTLLKLGGGDEPTLLCDDKDNPRNRGKWIEAVNAKEPNLTVELENATFATIKFEPSLNEKPSTAAPVDSPRASTAADPVEAKPGASSSASSRELLQNITPGQLKAASAKFASGVSHNCSHCSGKGTVVESEDAGTRRDGALVHKLTRDVTKTCEVCKGTGKVRATDEVLNRLAGNFVTSLAHLKREDPKTQDAISDAYKMITADMIGDYKTWILLTENGRSILSQKSPEASTPVVAKALVKQVLPRVGDKREYVVEIGGTDKRVRISDPVSADEVESGPVIVGGLVNPGSKDDPVTVLAHGFMVAPPIEEGWWWWYWWRPNNHP